MTHGSFANWFGLDAAQLSRSTGWELHALMGVFPQIIFSAISDLVVLVYEPVLSHEPHVGIHVLLFMKLGDIAFKNTQLIAF